MLKNSIKPYLLRAVYEWCTINHYTPHIFVKVDTDTKVPIEFMKNKKIIFNISAEAIRELKITNKFISFHARFNSVLYDIFIPINNVNNIYANENGEGIVFNDVFNSFIAEKYQNKLPLMLIKCHFSEVLNTQFDLVQEKVYSDSTFLKNKKKSILTRIK